MSKRPLQDDASSVDETKRRRQKSPPAPSFDSPDTTMHKMMDGIESSFQQVSERPRDDMEVSHVQQQQSGNGLTGASAFTAANAHTAEEVIAERAKAIRCTIDAISDQLASLQFHLSVNAGQSEAVAECVSLTSQVAEVGKDMRGLLLQNKANRENRDPRTLGLQELRLIDVCDDDGAGTTLGTIVEEATLKIMAEFSKRLSAVQKRIDTLFTMVGANLL